MMRCHFTVALSCWLALAIAAVGAAQDDQRRPGNVTFYWENDGTIIKPNNRTDRHYTNGAGVSFAWQPQFAQEWAGAIPGLGLDTGNRRAAAGFVLGHMIFTPEDIEAERLVRADQPYAGYLFFGGFLQRADRHTMDHFQLDLGFVGPSALGQDVQNFIHRWRGIDEANGWDNQLRDEFTFQFYARRKWRLPEYDPADTGFMVQLIPELGAALGTVHRHIEGDLLLRLGWNLPDDFGPGRLENIAAATASQPVRGWGIYGFFRAGGRLVEHNLLIEGNTFRDSHWRTIKPAVAQLQAGGALCVGWGCGSLGIAYSQTYLTEQFKGQRHHDELGALTITGTIWF